MGPRRNAPSTGAGRRRRVTPDLHVRRASTSLPVRSMAGSGAVSAAARAASASQARRAMAAGRSALLKMTLERGQVVHEAGRRQALQEPAPVGPLHQTAVEHGQDAAVRGRADEAAQALL